MHRQEEPCGGALDTRLLQGPLPRDSLEQLNVLLAQVRTADAARVAGHGDVLQGGETLLRRYELLTAPLTRLMPAETPLQFAACANDPALFDLVLSYVTSEYPGALFFRDSQGNNLLHLLVFDMLCKYMPHASGTSELDRYVRARRAGRL